MKLTKTTLPTSDCTLTEVVLKKLLQNWKGGKRMPSFSAVVCTDCDTREA